jgi:hypothetical protein
VLFFEHWDEGKALPGGEPGALRVQDISKVTIL